MEALTCMRNILSVIKWGACEQASEKQSFDMVVHVRSFLLGRGRSCAYTAIKLKDSILEFQVWFRTYGEVYFTEASLCIGCIPSFSGFCISCFFRAGETRLGESH